jgi:hypothetical protein
LKKIIGYYSGVDKNVKIKKRIKAFANNPIINDAVTFQKTGANGQ